MKIASHVLLFGQDKWIMRNIENAYPHVDKIYVAHSNEPWSYNSAARGKYKDTFDLKLITESKFNDKVQIINGVWDTEEDQRNACAEQAVKDGMEVMIIHDADEFYFNSQYNAAIELIRKNPDFDFYSIGWYCFWKSFKYVLLNEIGNPVVGFPQFAINLKRGVRFAAKRKPNKSKVFTIDPSVAVCYHGSYVLNDSEVYQKINTWGHANDFDREKWYKDIWLAWKPEMKNLHLVSPTAWSCASVFNGPLPEVIKDLK